VGSKYKARSLNGVTQREIEAENRRLKKENKRLRMERKILKKRRPSSQKSRIEIWLHPAQETVPIHDQ